MTQIVVQNSSLISGKTRIWLLIEHQFRKGKSVEYNYVGLLQDLFPQYTRYWEIIYGILKVNCLQYYDVNTGSVTVSDDIFLADLPSVHFVCKKYIVMITFTFPCRKYIQQGYFYLSKIYGRMYFLSQKW